MVVNDRYCFVFVHVPKVAGTSIANALKRLPGNRKDLKRSGTKHETAGEFGRYWRKRASLFRRNVRSLESFTLFGFVRDPWDRMASSYYYLVDKRRSRRDIPQLGTFQDYVERAYHGDTWLAGLALMKPQIDFFAGGEQIYGAALVGRYECFQDHLERVSQLLGVAVELEHTNRSKNTESDYRNLYSERHVEMVATLFHKDLKVFGYSFERDQGVESCLDRLW